MLSADIGKLIKQQRVAFGINQVELARLAAVSRTTLSRIEQGKAPSAQTDVLDRLLHALNIHPRILGQANTSLERQLARLQQMARNQQRKERHLRLALGIAGDPENAQAKIACAQQMVALWQQRKTCSANYIHRWNELLNLPPLELAQAMSSLGEWEDAMFQNTPWSWLWTS